MEETISLKELLGTIRKRLVMIVLITITAVLVAGVVSYFYLTPIYQASTQILVNQATTDQTQYNISSDVQASVQLVNTYNVVIKSPAILQQVANNLNDGLTVEQINKEIMVTSETNSQVIDLSVNDKDANRAAEIANETANVFDAQIAKIMKVNNVTILAKATPATSPIKPRPSLNMAIALVVGLMAGVGIAFLLEYLDTTVKNEQEIERLLELPILGAIATISELKMDEKSKRKHSKKHVRGESLGS